MPALERINDIICTKKSEKVVIPVVPLIKLNVSTTLNFAESINLELEVTRKVNGVAVLHIFPETKKHRLKMGLEGKPDGRLDKKTLFPFRWKQRHGGTDLCNLFCICRQTG